MEEKTTAIETGIYQELLIARKTDFGWFLRKEQSEVLLPNKFVTDEMKEGDMLEVFVYRDSEDRIVATTQRPKAIIGEFMSTRVVDEAPFGVFVDWGLDKDLLIPKNEQHKPLRKGDHCVVRVSKDYRADQVIGTTKLGAFINKETEELRSGDEVLLRVYEFTDLGIMALVDDQYMGMLYRNETFQKIEVGDLVPGYIKKVREDGKLDLAERAQGYSAIEGVKKQLLKKLSENEGFLPLHDKSAPELIQKTLEISKKNFKKAVGALYKEGLVTLSDEGIRLKA